MSFLQAYTENEFSRDPLPALYEKSAVPAATLPSSEAEKFSVSMTPGQPHDWLRSRQMPPADCKIIKGMHSE